MITSHVLSMAIHCTVSILIGGILLSSFMSHVHFSQLWVAILEKAYAKIHGCYQNIDGGIERYALYELTGAIHREIELSDPHTQALAASGKLWEV